MSPNAIVATGFDPVLVLLSVSIAVFASYTALMMADRMRASVGISHHLWLLGASLIMGGGIWSMHFVGMVAFQLPMQVSYDLWLTLLSLALPIAATAAGFHMVWIRGGGLSSLAAAGTLMGVGMAAMHYTGMAAMRMQASIEYQPTLVVVSVLIAVIASIVALGFAFRIGGTWQRLAGATALGLAISGMHYTAIAAARFSTGYDTPAAPGTATLDPVLLAVVIAGASFGLLFLTLLFAMYDRRTMDAGLSRSTTPNRALHRYSPKFALLVILLFVVTLIGVSWSLSTWSDYNETISGSRIATRNTAHLVQEHVERAVGEGDLAIRHVQHLIEQLGFEEVTSSKAIWRNVRDMSESLPHLGAIWVFDAEGRARFTTLQMPAPSDYNVADRPYFQAQRDNLGGELLLAGSIKGRITNPDSFNISRRLTEPDDSFAGLVLATFDPEYFEDFYKSLNLGHEAAIGIFREDGTVLARQPPLPPEADRSPRQNPLFTDHLPKSWFGTFDARSPIDGVWRILSYRKANELPLVMVASIAKDAAMAEWRSRLNQNGAVGLLIGTVLIALSWLAVRSLQREEQSQAAIRAAHADLDRRVQERTRALEEALSDKEVLFKEVHHRVKNNLQVICSLLSLQSARFREPAVRQAFEEAYNRVHSISLVHKTLYDQGSSARIDFAGYLRELCDSLAKLYDASGRGILVEVAAAEGTLDLNRAVPLALIVNEVISNALKHAFPEDRTGSGTRRISVEFAAQDQRIRLSIRDNGIGLPDEITRAPTKSLGLVIVDALSQQLEAETSFHRTDGTRFELTAPLDPPEATKADSARSQSGTTAAAE